MSDKPVTVSQFMQMYKMACEKGLKRNLLQHPLDDGTISRVLDAIKEGLPITIGSPLVAPVGARLITLKVKVQLDQEWQLSINDAGPDTLDNYNVRKVGNLNMPTGKGVVEEELILLNYPQGDGSWDKALAWAEQYNLRKTDPRRVFAIGKYHPKFNYEVGPNPAYVVATEECAFGGYRRACSVWWDDSERKARLDWVFFCGYARGWFVFRK